VPSFVAFSTWSHGIPGQHAIALLACFSAFSVAALEAESDHSPREAATTRIALEAASGDTYLHHAVVADIDRVRWMPSLGWWLVALNAAS
jgi:hypothetical protein